MIFWTASPIDSKIFGFLCNQIHFVKLNTWPWPLFLILSQNTPAPARDISNTCTSCTNYSDILMGAMASQITSPMIVYSIVYSGADQIKTSKLRITGLWGRNSPVTGEFPAQRASNAENVSIWWLHHGILRVHQTGINFHPCMSK